MLTRLREAWERLLRAFGGAMRSIWGLTGAPLLRGMAAAVRWVWSHTGAPLLRLLGRLWGVTGAPLLHWVKVAIGVLAMLARPLLEGAWRVLLIIAGAAMPVGGVLMALGKKDLSDTVVTVAFGIGILAVPCWFAARLCARAPDVRDLRARRRTQTPSERSEHEDLSGGAHQELGPNYFVVSGEPA